MIKPLSQLLHADVSTSKTSADHFAGESAEDAASPRSLESQAGDTRPIGRQTPSDATRTPHKEPLTRRNHAAEARSMTISRLTLIERISRFLRSIDKRGLEPSRWEGHCIKQALKALSVGDIATAEMDIRLAKLPPEQRTSDMLVSFSPESRSPPLAELQAELTRILASGAVGCDND